MDPHRPRRPALGAVPAPTARDPRLPPPFFSAEAEKLRRRFRHAPPLRQANSAEEAEYAASVAASSQPRDSPPSLGVPEAPPAVASDPVESPDGGLGQPRPERSRDEDQDAPGHEESASPLGLRHESTAAAPEAPGRGETPLPVDAAVRRLVVGDGEDPAGAGRRMLGAPPEADEPGPEPAPLPLSRRGVLGGLS